MILSLALKNVKSYVCKSKEMHFAAWNKYIDKSTEYGELEEIRGNKNKGRRKLEPENLDGKKKTSKASEEETTTKKNRKNFPDYTVKLSYSKHNIKGDKVIRRYGL